MPLLVGESIAVSRKRGFLKLQTDRSVGTAKSYLPRRNVSRGRVWTFSPRGPLLATEMFLPSGPVRLDIQVQNGPEMEHSRRFSAPHLVEARRLVEGSPAPLAAPRRHEMSEKRTPSDEKSEAGASPSPRRTESAPANGKPSKRLRLGKDCDYEKELGRLHIELVKFHEWIRNKGLKVVVLFEGRDAAGKEVRSSASPRN